MRIRSSEVYNILDIMGSSVLTKSGMITVSFFLEQPPCYSLDQIKLEERNNDYFRAFKHMGNNTYVHKQDIYLRNQFDSSIIEGDSFIQQGERRYFDGKDYINHYCFLSFSIAGLSSLESSYVKNPLKYKEHLTKYDSERLSSFLDEVESATAIINSMPQTRLTQLTPSEIQYSIFKYVNGFYQDETCIRDLDFDTYLKVGDKKGVVLALCDVNFLPDTLSTSVKDESLPHANSTLYSSMLDSLGVHLKYTHVINQIWHFDNAYKSELNTKVRQFGQHRNFGKEIEYEHTQLSALESELTSEGNIICKTHFNILILEEEQYINKAVDYVKNIFNVNDFRCYIPSNANMHDIYSGSVIGQNNALAPYYYFLTDLKSSLCLMPHYSTFKNDDKGLLFNDRLYNVPFRLDLWDTPQGNKIPARNGIIIASTGGGKSVTALDILQQYKEQGYKMIIVEFGKSFYQFTQLYQKDSLHIDYDGSEPLGINPFFLREGESLSIDKLNTLVNIVLKFWRSPETTEDAKQVVSLNKMLKHYYQHTKKDQSFPDFYNYIKTKFEQLSEELEIEEGFFDYKSFIHVCSEFLPGGKYENICKTSSLGDQIRDKDVIVFELTQIKKDPFLVNVIISILLDTIESKLLDRSSKGILVFDEYAETQTIKDTSDGSNIHQTVAFCYQKLRKENSAVMTIIQSPAQLSNDQFSKGIISNTQLLFVLHTTETVYKQVIETFTITNETHINLMKSMRNKFEGTPKYSELFIRFLDLDAIVVRLELSPEKFFAFQTDGEIWQELQNDFKQTGNIEESIVNKINQTKNEKKSIRI